MLKISDAVEEIVYSQENVLEALAGEYLNLSAYARRIRCEVEEKTKKPVTLTSIKAALTRLEKRVKYEKPLLPEVNVEDVSVKSGLIEMAYDRTKQNQARMRKLYLSRDLAASKFFVVTQGIGEITIIANAGAKKHIRKIFAGQKPKVVRKDLVSITARFAEDYLDTPNVTYAFVRAFGIKRINIIEVVSTYTEITFVLESKNMQAGFDVVNDMFLD